MGKSYLALNCVLSLLIEKGYSYSSSDEFILYTLENGVTRCAIRETEYGIGISLCLLEDIVNESYASEFYLKLECKDDLRNVLHVISHAEEYCNLQKNSRNIKTYYIVMETYRDRLRKCTIPVKVFEDLIQVGNFLKQVRKSSSYDSYRMSYKVYPVELKVEE